MYQQKNKQYKGQTNLEKVESDVESLKVKLEARQYQLQEGLAKYELENSAAIEKEIADTSIAYENATRKKQVKKAENLKWQLDELGQMKELVNDIIRSQSAIAQMCSIAPTKPNDVSTANNLLKMSPTALENDKITRLHQELQDVRILTMSIKVLLSRSAIA